MWVAAPHGRAGEHQESALWLAPVDGSTTARRLTGGGADTFARWSPDGRSIGFLSDRHERGTAALYLVDPSGGEAEPLLQRKRSIEALAWSPDSSEIAVLVPADPDEEDERREQERDDADVFGERPARNQLLTVPAAGGDVRSYALGELHPTVMAWSPDGSRIAFIARQAPELGLSAGAAVYLFEVRPHDASDGDQVQRVAPAPWADDLCWTAEGDDLFVLRRHGECLQSAVTVWTVPAVPDSVGSILGPIEANDAH